MVCPLAEVAAQCAVVRPSRVISLLAPGARIAAEPAPGTPQLNLFFNDIAAPREGLVAPDVAAIVQLLAFGAKGAGAEAAGPEAAGPEAAGDVILIYCWAGISRSPAAAFALACQRWPDLSEREIALALRQRAPWATPNPLMVRLADALLGRAGRMIDAVAAIGRGREASWGAPFELVTGA